MILHASFSSDSIIFNCLFIPLVILGEYLSFVVDIVLLSAIEHVLVCSALVTIVYL